MFVFYAKKYDEAQKEGGERGVNLEWKVYHYEFD